MQHLHLIPPAVNLFAAGACAMGTFICISFKHPAGAVLNAAVMCLNLAVVYLL